MENNKLYPLILEPTIKNYIWGGRSLIPYLEPAFTADNQPVAEIWAIYENNRILNGSFTGLSLADLAMKLPIELLGSGHLQKDQHRFPLLIKLLDCQDWLSIQVHPDDAKAHQLEGASFNGKTEAWFFIQADPDSQIIAGTRAGVSRSDLKNAIRKGSILDVLAWHTMQKNDYIYIPAGTVHALGPGLLVYELQQSSDLTYRVYDWDRSPMVGRELHIEKSLESADAVMASPHHLPKQSQDNQSLTLVDCAYFRLQHYMIAEKILSMDTNSASLHAITVIDGKAEIQTENGFYPLQKFESLLIPAALGSYSISGSCEFLLASNK